MMADKMAPYSGGTYEYPAEVVLKRAAENRAASARIAALERVLRGIRAGGKGVDHTYAKWVRCQVDRTARIEVQVP